MKDYLSDHLLGFIQTLKKSNILLNEFNIRLICDNHSKGASIDLSGLLSGINGMSQSQYIFDSKSVFYDICKEHGFLVSIFNYNLSEDFTYVTFTATLKSTVQLDNTYYVYNDNSNYYKKYVENKYSGTEKTEQITYEKQDRFELLDLK